MVHVSVELEDLLSRLLHVPPSLHLPCPRWNAPGQADSRLAGQRYHRHVGRELASWLRGKARDVRVLAV